MWVSAPSTGTTLPGPRSAGSRRAGTRAAWPPQSSSAGWPQSRLVSTSASQQAAFSGGLCDEVRDDVLHRAALLEDGALLFGAGLARRYVRDAVELGLAAEVLRDGA